MRGSQKELRRFMRDVKRGNPSTSCNLQYDKLWVGDRCYRWDMEEGRVIGMEVFVDNAGIYFDEEKYFVRTRNCLTDQDQFWTNLHHP